MTKSYPDLRSWLGEAGGKEAALKPGGSPAEIAAFFPQQKKILEILEKKIYGKVAETLAEGHSAGRGNLYLDPGQMNERAKQSVASDRD